MSCAELRREKLNGTLKILTSQRGFEQRNQTQLSRQFEKRQNRTVTID